MPESRLRMSQNLRDTLARTENATKVSPEFLDSADRPILLDDVLNFFDQREGTHKYNIIVTSIEKDPKRGLVLKGENLSGQRLELDQTQFEKFDPSSDAEKVLVISKTAIQRENDRKHRDALTLKVDSSAEATTLVPTSVLRGKILKNDKMK